MWACDATQLVKVPPPTKPDGPSSVSGTHSGRVDSPSCPPNPTQVLRLTAKLDVAAHPTVPTLSRRRRVDAHPEVRRPVIQVCNAAAEMRALTPLVRQKGSGWLVLRQLDTGEDV